MTSALIIEKAMELGFERAGIVPVEESPHSDFLDRWLADEMHGEMGYMARNLEKRKDPRLLHPGSRSVLSVALNYKPEEDDGRYGGIARYARGADYPRLMRRRLAQLGRFIEQEIGEGACVPRATVDSAPVMERGIAEKAGLGWFGKNANIISQEMGSFLFLGELFLGVDLPSVVHREPDRCGRCTDCIDLCPTGAIVAPYTVDSRRCISYLTIELKGAIPRELRPMIGDHLFGCDICQLVCPWNRKSPQLKEAAFRPRVELMGMTAADLLRLSEMEFSLRFRGSPVRRAKRVGMARNAAVVLGNSGDSVAIPVLSGALREDESPLVRGHAAWGLGCFDSSSARAALEWAQLRETTPFVLEEIDCALRGETVSSGT